MFSSFLTARHAAGPAWARLGSASASSMSAAASRRLTTSCQQRLAGHQLQRGPRRFFSAQAPKPAAEGASSSAATPGVNQRERNMQLAMYATAGVVAVVGLSYASVPLYQMFCQATGYGGTTQKATEEQFKNMKPVEGARQLTVHFTADTSASMPWTFLPQQKAVRVVPGETALAFYTAHNPTDAAVTGVSTYNVTPARAGLYFHKIQCFCFEEQRLRPHEEIDMPVFFYVDPAFLKDPAMENVKSLTLSYTFFRTGEPEVADIASEIRRQELKRGGTADSTQARVDAWMKEVADKTGVAVEKLQEQGSAALKDAAAAGKGGQVAAAGAAEGPVAAAPSPSPSAQISVPVPVKA